MDSCVTFPEQARGLSRICQPEPVRVLAVASGKGGVGKSNLSANLASVFAQRNKSVVLMDADLGLANIDVLLGVRPHYDLHHVLSGERSLEEILVETPQGIKLIPAASGVQRMAGLSAAEHTSIVHAFSELSVPVDMLIVDTAAGINDSVISFSLAAQEVIVVVCDEPASITDAYALIKVLNRDNGINRFQIVTSMVRNASQGFNLYQTLAAVADQYLHCSLGYLGHVPLDNNLQLAVRRQRPVVQEFPDSKSAMAMKQIAGRIESLPVPQASAFVAFFLERMVEASSRSMGAG